MKKSKKDIIEKPEDDTAENEELDKAERESMIDAIMEHILSESVFKETFEKMAAQPITMLLPHKGRNSFYLYSPITQSFRFVKAPTEATVIEASNGKETMCLIHNVPYMVPDKYLKNVGYN